MSDLDELEAIKQLKARYFRTLDTKDWDGLEAVFTPDVAIDMTGEGGAVTRSAHAFVASLVDVIGAARTVHHGHMPEIALTSPTTATGIWAMEDEIWWPDGGPIARLHGYGHYYESYEKTRDGWRITSMRLVRIRREIEP